VQCNILTFKGRTYVNKRALFSHFSGFWNRQVVCQAPFFRKRTRPLPLMSLAPAALHQKRLKRFIEWRPTLNWEMNNRKIHQLEGSHLNLQLTHWLENSLDAQVPLYQRNPRWWPPGPTPGCPLAATLHPCGELQSMPISWSNFYSSWHNLLHFFTICILLLFVVFYCHMQFFV